MPQPLRFIIVPKVAHPWYDEVCAGARAQAETLARELGVAVAVEYEPPSSCDAGLQNAILERLAASRPTGVAIDPVDTVDHMAAINRLRSAGIPVVLFDSPSPDPSITSVGNDFARQGTIAAERLVALIGSTGKVAVMQGFPSAPNHRARYEAQLAVLGRHPGIRVVDGGTDNDDIETARRQAAAVLAAHPDLAGYLCCDASGPIGIAAAIREAGKAGKVKAGQIKFVGIDGIRPILEAVKEGVIDSSSSTIPRLQGSMSILMLWQASIGLRTPQSVDTGIDLITQDNVDAFLAETPA